MNGLAFCHIKLGNYAKAIQILKQALNIGAAYADIYNNLGLAYLYEKQYAKALTNFQEALHINPRYKEAHYNLAILYLESTLHDKTANLLPPASIRIERAKQQLQKLYDTGNKAMKAIETKLNTYIKEEEIGKAVKLLSESRNKVFPEEVLSLIGMDFYLKLMYGGKGLNDDIIRKFEMRLYKAVNDHPNYADLWNNLGIVHLIQCRNLFLQALTEFDQALNINPSFDKALKNKKLVENDGKEFLILLRAILR
jgi:tetratricopeptide (TPR) repeat protein